MANVLLGVTGSVAAIKVPELFAALRGAGHAVKVVATGAATYFFDPAAIEPLPGGGATGRSSRSTRTSGPAGATRAATTCCTSSCGAGARCC